MGRARTRAQMGSPTKTSLLVRATESASISCGRVGALICAPGGGSNHAVRRACIREGHRSAWWITRVTTVQGRPKRHMGDTVNAVDLPELLVGDAGEWRRWLSDHHADSQGVWLVLAKKGTVDPTTVSYDEALDEAICFGWIDGQLGRRDAATFRRRFTPRKARSPWSQLNAAIAERLIATGRMHRSGEDEVRQAKEDGRWEAAYAGQASIEVPEDLVTALSANPRANAMFEMLTSANRYAILYRIGNAKKPETRSRRIGQFVEMLARGETIHPQALRSPK